MKRLFALALMLAVLTTGLTSSVSVLAQEKGGNKAKEALMELGDFIGEWNSACEVVNKSLPLKGFWKEKFEWGWRFKGDASWLALKFTDSKLYKSGDLKFDVKENKYVLNLVGVDDKSRDYKGELKKGRLELETVIPETKESERVTLTTAAEGIRFLYFVDRRAEGTTFWNKYYKGEANKVGESLGRAEKKNLCVVTFGLGTSQVSHQGKSYWVCCSGCRDAFAENPEKFIKEFEAKMKKK